MLVQFKVTNWEQVNISHYPKEFQDSVLEKIKTNQISSVSDLTEYIEEHYDEEVYAETMEFASEPLSVKENGGQPTIEICTDNGFIFDNVVFEERNNENVIPYEAFEEILATDNNYSILWKRLQDSNLDFENHYQILDTIENNIERLKKCFYV